MSTSNSVSDTDGSILEEYVLGVRIVETDETGDDYRFEAPDHVGITFDSLEDARLYADVYFDVNGFVEADTGARGVPPEIIQAGKDTLAAYLLTLPWADTSWVASFYGVTPTDIDRYRSWVHDRAEEIRAEVTAQDLE
ncbi:hypothetical protein [Halostagnicola kamekurae]|uniref:Uncharacterized protein n=1 Tax=Halostagnicola kamekurae TaxID=619731 RepID=A0A1I6RUN6_9EURY|nr:hypothetical protein [Halostagnicola kamekurae]SFS68310.1 hypothetical protein SAMN04488556_2138 [Halostagnicola kamekurae]